MLVRRQKSWGLGHVYLLFKNAIEEDIVNIKLLKDQLLEMAREYKFNNYLLYYRGKSLLVMKA